MFGLILEPDEKQLEPYRGAAVCLVMKDGSRKIGQLTACGSGRLILNGEGENGEAKISRKNGARRLNRKRTRKAQASSETVSPPVDGEWGDLSISPIGMEPYAPAMPKENIPLKTVESVIIL